MRRAEAWLFCRVWARKRQLFAARVSLYQCGSALTTCRVDVARAAKARISSKLGRPIQRMRLSETRESAAGASRAANALQFKNVMHRADQRPSSRKRVKAGLSAKSTCGAAAPRILNETAEVVAETTPPIAAEHFRGGSQAIEFAGGRLALVHELWRRSSGARGRYSVEDGSRPVPGFALGRRENWAS
jgi:hypothetical protein